MSKQTTKTILLMPKEIPFGSGYAGLGFFLPLATYHLRRPWAESPAAISGSGLAEI